MAEKRKSAKDWRNSYNDAKSKVKKIENQIKDRLIELCRLFPDAEISSKYADDILNSSNLNTEGMINIIDNMEKWIAAQHPHQQTEIEFVPDNTPIGIRATYDSKNGLLLRSTKPADFIEYEDNGDNYESPERKEVAEQLPIRLYCMHDGCNKYIKGVEGYNGAFTAETGQTCDLRNQGFYCKEHSKE